MTHLVFLSLALAAASVSAENVALVIGGVQSAGPISSRASVRQGACGADEAVTQLATAEVYGCPSNVFPEVGALPSPLTLASGVFWEKDGLKSVLLCGGVDCFESQGAVGAETNKCFLWDPIQDTWLTTLALADPLEDFLLTLTGASDPIALGGLTTDHEPSTLTRTVSATEGKWNEAGRLYEEADAPIPTMEGAACMVRVEDTIYEIGADSVATYDLTFNVGSKSVIDPTGALGSCVDTMSCSCTAVGNGIMLSSGKYLDLDDNKWYDRAAPPAGSVLSSVDGVPTVFGVPSSSGGSGSDVMQYDVETNTWAVVGQLETARTLPTVVEIPMAMCDYLDFGRTTDAPAPTDGGGDGSDGAGSVVVSLALTVFAAVISVAMN